MKQEGTTIERKKALFLWILSLIRLHVVSGILAVSIHESPCFSILVILNTGKMPCSMNPQRHLTSFTSSFYFSAVASDV